jgi:hypothetical protein
VGVKLVHLFIEIKRIISLIFLFLILLSCAKKGIPPGGPEDKTPPRVISVFPSADSTQVSKDVEIHITFSERMEKKKTEASIFISPLPENPWKIGWHKYRLSLKPPEPLKLKTTYVITIGTGACDLHGNGLKESYSFAFSTGDFIDSCQISGEAQVKEKKEAGISIWAFLLTNKAEVDLLKEKPAYVTQTDFKGKYKLSNLSSGKYRLFAVKDKNKDLIWDMEDEPIGVTTQEVVLDSVIFSRKNMNFILAGRDTIPPSLINCQTLDRNKIRLDFDEKLNKAIVLNTNNYLIRSQKNLEKTLNVPLAYFQEENTKSVFIVTQGMESDEKYELLVSDLQDESGNEIDTALNSCLFSGTGLPDTVGLEILYTLPEDKKTDVPLDSYIKIYFSEPPEKSSLESNLILKDENEEPVSGKFFWESAVIFILKPDSLLSSRTTYKVQLKQAFDFSNNLLIDSLFEISFTTLNQDTLGLVSGEVKILGNKQKENIVVVLKKINSNEIRYEKLLEDPGKFLLDMVLPGKYLAMAFIDKDKDRKHGIGEVFPYIPAEPYTTFPDTIPVRSRWETEKVELIFE